MVHGQAFPGPNISGLTTNDRASHIRHWWRARQQIDVNEWLPRKTANIRYTRRGKTSLKYNTICFRHHYSQTSTNNVNKIWTVDCLLVPASSTLHNVLDYTRLLYTSSSDTTIRVIYTLKVCVSKYNNYITCSFHLEGPMLLVKR